ncbi:MAG: tetratricopeptide repeat protein, partial [Pirellulales bacterium]
HLVPFPEDAADEQAAQTKPAKPQPPQSDFRPRFKTPPVKQAQHLEPVVEKPATGAHASDEAEDADPQAPKEGAAIPSTTLQGREALDEAYAKSKTAESESDYTEVIELCRRAQSGGVNKTYEEYANRLLGWAYNRRGEALAKEGKNADALADFEAAVAAGGAWRAIHNRGVGYAGVGRHKDAMADFDRAIELNPRFAQAYFNRGELRYKLLDDQGAISDYTLAVKVGPPDAPMYSSRGHAFYRMKRFGDALRDYGMAISLDPQNAAALVNRGDTYSDLGQYGEAAKDYRAAVRVAPSDGRAFQAAAWLMATCPDAHYRDDKLAVDAAKRAIELDGTTYRNLSTLAAAQASAGLFGEAQKTQEQAIAAAAKEDVLTAEKMMALYQREIAFRDRPLTAFKTPEEMTDNEVRQAAANAPIDPNAAGPPGRRTWFQSPPSGPRGTPQGGTMGAPRRLPPPSQVPGQMPGQRPGQIEQPPKARLFSPRGRI